LSFAKSDWFLRASWISVLKQCSLKMAGVFYSRKMLQNGEVCKQRSLGSWNLEMNFNCSHSRSSRWNLRICRMQKKLSYKCLCYAHSSIVKYSFLWSVKGLHLSCIAALLHCLESYVQVVKYATSFGQSLRSWDCRVGLLFKKRVHICWINRHFVEVVAWKFVMHYKQNLYPYT
jgi:hypothetical protein